MIQITRAVYLNAVTKEAHLKPKAFINDSATDNLCEKLNNRINNFGLKQSAKTVEVYDLLNFRKIILYAFIETYMQETKVG